MIFPTHYDPKAVCQALGIDPRLIRSIHIGPDGACVVEVVIFDPDGMKIVRGNDVLTAHVTLERA